MNKDFERCCSFLADMIIKYAPEIKEEVEVCMMIKDSIDNYTHPAADQRSEEQAEECFKGIGGI